MELCVFLNHGSCQVLDRKDCKGCTFHQTEESLVKSRKKAIERLEQLGIFKHYQGIYSIKTPKIKCVS